MDAVGTAIVAGLAQMRTACNTLAVASGRWAVRKLVVHADRAVVTALMLASLTVVCDMKSGGIPPCSWLPLP